MNSNDNNNKLRLSGGGRRPPRPVSGRGTPLLSAPIDKAKLQNDERAEMMWDNTRNKPDIITRDPIQPSIINDNFGTSSVLEVVAQFQRDNVCDKAIMDIQLAQELCRIPNNEFFNNDPIVQEQNSESQAILLQGIITGTIRKNHHKSEQINEVNNDEIINRQVRDLRKKLYYKYQEQESIAATDKKADKNAKRNAKRRAKAKKTKETLNFTPTKEQEEWFWGGPP